MADAMGLDEAAARAAGLIRSRPRGTRWFLACDSDADGLCAAAVMAAALRRIGHRFQVRAGRDKTTAAYEALAGQDCDGYILLDKGSSHAATLEALQERTGRPVLIIDHHNPQESAVVQVNPRLEGMDGSRDASAATTAVAVALALDEANMDMAPIGLSGATGDWQHEGGWQGWNEELVTRCLDAGHLRERPLPALIGVDLADAFARTTDVDAAQARRILTELEVDAEADMEDLDAEAVVRLHSAWSLQRLAQGQPASAAVPMLWNTRLDTGVRHAFRIIDACGRTGDAGTGLSFALGHAGARERAGRRFIEYKKRLVQALAQAHDGVADAGPIRWTRIDDPDLTGMVAGLTVVRTRPPVPLLVAAPRPDGALQVSTRASHDHVAAGLDLGRSIQRAAAAVDAEGGGHPIASGAVVAAERFDAFLDALVADLAQGSSEAAGSASA